MAAAALIVGGCGGAVGGGAVGGKAGPGARDGGSSAGLAGRTAGPGATASASGSGLAGQRPVSAPAGSPLSARWTGDGKPVTLAFGGDVHFAGVLGARLAADPATALSGSVGRLVSGADVA